VLPDSSTVIGVICCMPIRIKVKLPYMMLHQLCVLIAGNSKRQAGRHNVVLQRRRFDGIWTAKHKLWRSEGDDYASSWGSYLNYFTNDTTSSWRSTSLLKTDIVKQTKIARLNTSTLISLSYGWIIRFCRSYVTCCLLVSLCEIAQKVINRFW